MPEEIDWLSTALVLAVQEAQLAEHGGARGIRDAGLLESALARPQNAAAYANPDVPELAALYALGIIRNHPFVDGNKRVATVLLETFLELHGYALAASDAELFSEIMALAASEVGDDAFTAWVRQHSRRT
ncbi:MAG: type II toxin-antitoxin system death-on-curing family toxin [Candidatus Eremiobacteraeota bacterium]|nr:type II toxin-antitoxin system death-on-curing family toxin [Candidatus Eremiobacteraeota bacterium]